MDYKEEIQKILEELERLGFDRNRVEKGIPYEKGTIASALSRGGNKIMFERIKEFHTKTMAKLENPSLEVLERVERLEAMQDAMLTAIADVVSILTHRSSAIIKAEYEKLITDKLNKQ